MIKTAHRLQCLRGVNSPLLEDHFVLNISQPFLRVGHDYFTEFLAKLDCVTIPKGETLQAAFERAKRRKAPSKVLVIPNDGVQLLASLCREVQEMAGDQPSMPCQMTAAKVFGRSSHRSIFQLDSRTKNDRNIKIGGTRNLESESSKIFLRRIGGPKANQKFLWKK